MKKLMISVLLFFALTGCANTRINIFGMDVTEMSKRDVSVSLAGAVASLTAHVAGHYIAAEIVGVNIHQEGTKEIYEPCSDYENRTIDRGGFLFQIAVNGILILTTEDSYFTLGYTTATVLELVTYPILHPDDGDFHR